MTQEPCEECHRHECECSYPCKYGHFDCADFPDGPCGNEREAARAARQALYDYLDRLHERNAS